MAEQVEWRDFSLTHLEYPAGDWMGFVLCFFSLLPLAMIVSLVTLIVFRRDLHTICLFVGVCLCELINTLLKHTLKQQRPAPKRTNFSSYGMPSSHSQLSWFLAAYLVFFLLFRIHRGNSELWPLRLWRHLTAVFSCLCAAIVSYSRVHLQYHSWAQVVCGACVGVLLATTWFAVVHFLLTPYFQSIVQWRICQLLLVCDTSSIPSILWFEYTHKQMEARARWRRGLSSNKLQ